MGKQMKQLEYKVVHEAIEVDNDLHALDLDREKLLEAAEFGASERAFCTDNDPLGFASVVFYAKTARRLREVYCTGRKTEWVKDNKFNQAAIRHPSKKIRVVPCNFDQYAGNKDRDPTNKSPKGEVTRRKTACNMTGWLPGLPNIHMINQDENETWILGGYVTEQGILQAELSLPVGFEDNYFTAFAKRIILTNGRDGFSAGKRKINTPNDTVEVVDIPIKRK